MAAYLEDYIGKRHYSPAAAAQEIILQGLPLPGISASTVYRYIHRGYLHLCGLDLPVGRYNVKQKPEQRPAKSHKNDRSIDERAPEIETREDVGYWEMDTVVGKSAGPSRCLLVLTERKTRFEIVRVLESKTAREVLRVLRELAAHRTTMIIVTHEMKFARDVADRILFMDGGVVVEQGDAKQVIDHPQEERTRKFLASHGK